MVSKHSLLFKTDNLTNYIIIIICNYVSLVLLLYILNKIIFLFADIYDDLISRRVNSSDAEKFTKFALAHLMVFHVE